MLEAPPKNMAKTKGNNPGPGSEKLPTPRFNDIKEIRREKAIQTPRMILLNLFIFPRLLFLLDQ
jgi:hypothetical protein